MAMVNRMARRVRRHLRVRKRVVGIPERPRLVVRRSHLHLYAQVVDDLARKTLVSCSTLQPEFRKQHAKGGNVEAAKHLGEWVAQSALSAGIKRVAFDRGGYLYHGRVKALAEGARGKGLEL